MIWHESTRATTQGLTRLLVRGGHVDSTDLDVALTARRAVPDLAGAMHLDISGRGAGTSAPTLAGLASDSVRALGQLIHRTPRPEVERCLAAVTASQVSDPIAAVWTQVADQATLAHHFWSQGRSSRPHGNEAWSLMRHVAVLAQAVAVPDPDLAASARTAGRNKVADLLAHTSHPGLREAAVAVRTPADGGPLPPVTDLRQPPSRQLVAVHGRRDLSAALVALRNQMDTTAHNGPGPVQQIASAAARATTSAAAQLAAAAPHRSPLEHDRAGTPDSVMLASTLTTHARHLSEVAVLGRRTETLHPSDPVPAVQAKVISQWLTLNPSEAGVTLPGRHLSASVDVARAAAELTQSLHRLAHRLYDGGYWLVPVEPARGGPAHDWAASRLSPTPPALLLALQRACEHAAVLRQAAGPIEVERVRPGATSPERTRGPLGTAEALATLHARTLAGPCPASPGSHEIPTRERSRGR